MKNDTLYFFLKPSMQPAAWVEGKLIDEAATVFISLLARGEWGRNQLMFISFVWTNFRFLLYWPE